MGRQPDDLDVIDKGNEVREYGTVRGDPIANAIVKWLAGFGALLAASAIGFAYGRIFDHESRIAGLEAVEKYKDEQRRDKTLYSGVQANGRP